MSGVMGIFDLYDRAELARRFGAPVLQRGSDYVETGHVLSCEISDANPRITLVHGQVQGSGGRSYGTTVTLAEDPSGAWIDARCTCPVVRMCKHAAALMLVATRERGAEGGRDWERRLSLVLDELDDDAEAAVAAKNPLGLLCELTPTASGRRPGALRIRPVQRGARNGWVRTQVGWTDVPYLDRRPGFDPVQVRLLADILSAHRAANRQAYFGAESHLSVSTFGPSLWPLLREARAAGLTLVPAGQLDGLDVAPGPVSLRLDVNGADTDRAHMRLGVDLDGTWFSGDRLEVLGSDGHGVALWEVTRSTGSGSALDRRWRVVLAPLARPAGPQSRRMIAAGESLPVPRGDLPDLVGEYLPRLQRHLPVVSSDDTVKVPEAAEPRLALTVTWTSVDEVHVAWSYRYRVGQDDRIYALGETRGMRGVRRPEAERALLDALELDEEQVHRLCGSSRRDHGLVPEQTFEGMTAVAFTQDTLVPLEVSGQVEIEEVGARPAYQELTDAPEITFSPGPGRKRPTPRWRPAPTGSTSRSSSRSASASSAWPSCWRR